MVYNTSLVVLAQIETGIAFDAFSSQLQEQLLEIARAYWGLYLDRGLLLQKQRSYQRAMTVLSDLEHRQEIDAVAAQVVRARAEVAARLGPAASGNRGPRQRIAHPHLVNDPNLGAADQFELIPLDVPTGEYIPVNIKQSLSVALQNRPEVGQAVKRIQASAVRLNMSKSELLPLLNLVLESYLKGLRESDIWSAWGDQFTDGSPSYAVGLQLELPLHNRAARARWERRRLEARQLQGEFETTVQTLTAEVEVAVRHVVTSFREMHAKYQAMDAAARDVAYIQRRWKLLPGAGDAASLLLEDLLASQDRLADEEMNFLTAQVVYSVSLVELKRALGTLLEYEQVTPMSVVDDCLPTLHLSKSSPTPPPDRSPLAPNPDSVGHDRP